MLSVAAGILIVIVSGFYRHELLPGIFGNNCQTTVETACISQLSILDIDEEDLLNALGNDSIQPVESDIIAEYLVIEDIDLENMINEL